jgi:hypothetical protein
MFLFGTKFTSKVIQQEDKPFYLLSSSTIQLGFKISDVYFLIYSILDCHVALLNAGQKKLTCEMALEFSKTKIISNVWYKK